MGEIEECYSKLTSSRTLLNPADKKDAAVQRQLLWRLYHITSEINESTRKVEAANDQLTDLRASAVSLLVRVELNDRTIARGS